jgi:hypothetical protein
MLCPMLSSWDLYNNWAEVDIHGFVCVKCNISWTFGTFKISKHLLMGQSNRLTIEKKFWTWRSRKKIWYWKFGKIHQKKLVEFALEMFCQKNGNFSRGKKKKHQNFKAPPTNEYGLQMGISLFLHTSHILVLLLCNHQRELWNTIC